MSLYTFFKFIHITAAIVWIGGVFTLSILSMRFFRHHDRPAMLALADQSKFYGKSIIGPSAMLTLIAGIVMVAVVGLAASLWVVWGLVAALLSMAIGGFFTSKLGNKLEELVAAPDSSQAQLLAVRKRIGLLNVFDVFILLSAVWMMVFKPVL